jgi:hypothetical protein
MSNSPNNLFFSKFSNLNQRKQLVAGFKKVTLSSFVYSSGGKKVCMWQLFFQQARFSLLIRLRTFDGTRQQCLPLLPTSGR